jgi:hypothetical protein
MLCADTLAGVFLTDTNPPDVTACNGIGKVFPIGDGGTFKIPPTATRLVLGMPDECTGGAPAGGTPGCYGDNSGAISATFNLSSDTSSSGDQTGVILIDPVPALIRNASITNDVSDLINSQIGRPVDGVAADGLAQLVVRIPACKVGENINVTIFNDSSAPSSSLDDDGGISNQPSPDLSLYSSQVSTSAISGENDDESIALIFYRAPLNFASNSITTLPSSRTISLKINTPSQPEPIIRKIVIVRPPVVLLHGIWSSASTWNIFKPRLTNSDFTAIPLGYAATNARGVELNANILLPSLKTSITTFANAFNVAAVRADIVAHSMGGLIARAFVGNLEFADDGNYKSGAIHKLITIDTPHNGTLLANRLISSNGPCHDIFAINGLSVDEGAVADLSVGSNLLRDLQVNESPTHSVPSHAIVGIANSDQESLTEAKLLVRSLATGCGLLPNGSFQKLFGEASDLLVPVSSQSGVGLAAFNGPVANTIVNDVVHQHDSYMFIFGTPVLSSPNVINEIIRLLNSRISNIDFTPIKPSL